MPIIECGITKASHYLLFLSFPFFWSLHYLCYLFLKGGFFNESRSQDLNRFIPILILFIGKFGSGIFECISLRFQNNSRNVSMEMQYPSAKGKITFIPSKEKLGLKKRYLFVILLLSMTDFVTLYWSNLISCDMKLIEDALLHYRVKGFQILPTLLMFKCYLRNRIFYKHQKVSLFMIGLSFTLIILNTFYFEHDKKHYDILIIILQHFAIFTLNAFEDVTEKWFMDEKSLSPYRLLCYEGGLGLGLMAIAIPLAPYYLQCFHPHENKEEVFLEGLKNLFTHYDTIILFFVDICLNCAYRVFHCKISQQYTPVHLAVCETFYSFTVVLVLTIMITTFNWSSLIIYSSLTVVLFFFSLIYNEIVILYLCGLGLDIKKEITQRGINEISEETQVYLEEEVTSNYTD